MQHFQEDTSDSEERGKCENCDVRGDKADYSQLPDNLANSDLGRTVGTLILVRDHLQADTSGNHGS